MILFTNNTAITCKNGWLYGSFGRVPIHEPRNLETRCKNRLDFLCRLKFQVKSSFGLKTEIGAGSSEDTLLDCCTISNMRRSMRRRIDCSLDEFSQINVEKI